MSDATNESIYDVLKPVQFDLPGLKFGQQKIRRELNVMRGHLVSIQGDMHNIYLKLDRLERVERRLELREMAEAGTSYEPRS